MTKATTAPRDLATIGVELRRQVRLAEKYLAKALEHAIQAGELLIEAKARVGHGEWLPWLAENFDRTPRTASNWMLLARNKKQVSHLGSVSEALDALVESVVDRRPAWPQGRSPCPEAVVATHQADAAPPDPGCPRRPRPGAGGQRRDPSQGGAAAGPRERDRPRVAPEAGRGGPAA